jgi:hypothetical protein
MAFRRVRGRESSASGYECNIPGKLTIFTSAQADVQLVLPLPPGAFRPAPKIQSAAVRLTFKPPRDLDPGGTSSGWFPCSPQKPKAQ